MTAEPAYTALLSGAVPARAVPRLAAYAELLERWSARHNLVRFGSRAELVSRHIVESLAVCPHMAPCGRLLDVGSGAGLPGIPVLCAMPGWCGILLEPRRKRWAFLKLVVRELGLEADVAMVRFEDWVGEGVDLVTARAVGRHRHLLGWARRRLEKAGVVALWATESEEEELRELSGWRVLSSPLTGLDRGRLIRFQGCFT